MKPDVRRSDVDPELGFYRLHFLCPGCGLALFHETWDETRCFGAGSVLYAVRRPQYCPDCGLKIDWETKEN